MVLPGGPDSRPLGSMGIRWFTPQDLVEHKELLIGRTVYPSEEGRFSSRPPCGPIESVEPLFGGGVRIRTSWSARLRPYSNKYYQIEGGPLNIEVPADSKPYEFACGQIYFKGGGIKPNSKRDRINPDCVRGLREYLVQREKDPTRGIEKPVWLWLGSDACVSITTFDTSLQPNPPGTHSQRKASMPNPICYVTTSGRYPQIEGPMSPHEAANKFRSWLDRSPGCEEAAWLLERFEELHCQKKLSEHDPFVKQVKCENCNNWTPYDSRRSLQYCAHCSLYLHPEHYKEYFTHLKTGG